VVAEKALETAHRLAREKLQDRDGKAVTRAQHDGGQDQGQTEPAPTEPGGGVPRPPRFDLTLLMLLKQKSVQDELKLTPAQVTVAEEGAESEMRAFNKLFSLEPEERAKRRKELTKENDQMAVRILTPEQAKRLRQISLQVQGPRAFADPQIARALNLAEEQTQHVEKIVEQAEQQMHQLFQPGISPEEANRRMSNRRMKELEKNALEKIVQLMTPG